MAFFSSYHYRDFNDLHREKKRDRFSFKTDFSPTILIKTVLFFRLTIAASIERSESGGVTDVKSINMALKFPDVLKVFCEEIN